MAMVSRKRSSEEAHRIAWIWFATTCSAYSISIGLFSGFFKMIFKSPELAFFSTVAFWFIGFYYYFITTKRRYEILNYYSEKRESKRKLDAVFAVSFFLFSTVLFLIFIEYHNRHLLVK
jgi:hypothetical protein